LARVILSDVGSIKQLETYAGARKELGERVGEEGLPTSRGLPLQPSKKIECHSDILQNALPRERSQ